MIELSDLKGFGYELSDTQDGLSVGDLGLIVKNHDFLGKAVRHMDRFQHLCVHVHVIIIIFSIFIDFKSPCWHQL